MTTFDDLPLFRNTDPQGSVNGAKHITPKRGSQAMRLLAIYAQNPIMGLTDEEASSQAGILHGWKRCADLRRMGLIEPTGSMRPTVAQVNAMVCRITQQGLEALK
jgi:hypothetical protein